MGKILGVGVRADAAIPVIDLGPCLAGVPGALQSAAAALRRALERIGFFILVNHGVPQRLIDQTFAEARRFHDLTWWYDANYNASLQDDAAPARGE